MPMLSLRAWTYLGTGALIALLVGALLITRGTLADCRDARQAAETSLATSNKSIGTLTATIIRMNGEQAKLAADDAARISASREALEMARAAERWREAAIDRLTASAKAIETGGDLCEASPAVQAVWN